ncbi:MAG: hypothetical protein NT154_35310 [Verrucomicrobia bacterium]|nr:hypothetical protein [Verrucomicrobiota bacterium]
MKKTIVYGWIGIVFLAGYPGQAAVPTTNDAEVLKVTVSRRELVRKPVSPLLCGNFIEDGFGRQVEMLWSEMLFNPSFEVIPPVHGWWGPAPGGDYHKEAWWHSGYEENPWYVSPTNSTLKLDYARYCFFRHGLQSARLPASPGSASLAQDGLYLRPGVNYTFTGFVALQEPKGLAHDVTVGFYHEQDLTRPIVTQRITDLDSSWTETCTWKRVLLALTNQTYEGRATFAVTRPGGTELRLDGLSLMPSDNVQGWRREAIEALQRVNPRVIRWPGGCYASFYHWRDGIGPAEDRRPRESFWGGLAYNNVGTAEFVGLCAELSTEPLICVNMLTGTAAEAADWVAYCNASASKPGGALRKSHGYAKPFGVKYWELENEAYRKYTSLEYARLCVEYARLMKRADPSIKLAMIGYANYRRSLPQMLEIAGKWIDLVTDRAADAGTLKVIEAYNRQTGRHIRLCNTEDYPPAGSRSSLELGLNTARELLTYQRLGGDFAWMNFNNLANTWGQNVVECSKKTVWLSSAGLVMELFSRCPAAWPLQLDANAEDLMDRALTATGLGWPVANRPASKPPPVIVQAAWDMSRKTLVLLVLNYEKTPKSMVFDLTATGLKARTQRISTISAPDLGTCNYDSNHQAIRRTDREQPVEASPEFHFLAPPLSISQVLLRP